VQEDYVVTNWRDYNASLVRGGDIYVLVFRRHDPGLKVHGEGDWKV